MMAEVLLLRKYIPFSEGSRGSAELYPKTDARSTTKGLIAEPFQIPLDEVRVRRLCKSASQVSQPEHTQAEQANGYASVWRGGGGDRTAGIEQRDVR